MNDQKRVENFLKDFTKKLVNIYGKKIDFILLFGSAARGEWKRGLSDVDLIIQLKDKKIKKEFYENAEKIFWKLDKKYDTKFHEVCSIKDSKKFDIIEVIRFAERQARLYVPFEVIGPGEIDWKKCDFNDPFYKIGAFLIFPKSMFFLKIKAEGKILFGRDIIKELKPYLGWWDIPKILLNPFHLSVLAVLTVPLSPNFAIKHAIKATLYEIESVHIFLQRPIVSGVRNTYKSVRKLIGDEFIDWDIVEGVFDLKYNWEENINKLSHKEKIIFCWKILFFIIFLGWTSVFLKILSYLPKIGVSNFMKI